MTRVNTTTTLCFHCGDRCAAKHSIWDEKPFCCNGCVEVYRLLHEHDLCGYYTDEAFAGQTPISEEKMAYFAVLENAETAATFLKFKSKDLDIVEWNLPQMHCASCVWLLEHLPKFNAGIKASRVQFVDKCISIQFNPTEVNLREIAVLLSKIGYEPHLVLPNSENKNRSREQRLNWIVLGVTGFCFANIMLLSLPEYLGLEMANDPFLSAIFRCIALVISVPALLIGGKAYYKHAWQALRKKRLHIDLGIALSITLTFARSVYEILWGLGSGYLDSMTGILFFMHIGRLFQQKTHDRIHFELKFQHFFPLHVTRITHRGARECIAVQNIVPDDMLEVAYHDLIATDSLSMVDQALVDYSFVTGESAPHTIRRGEIIYAGGRNAGPSIRLKAIQPMNQSYLSQLWNRQESRPDTEHSFGDRVGTYFTVLLLFISLLSFSYWHHIDTNRAWTALTTVLIVACPCALLLSTTFTQGALLRHLSRFQIFIKNASVLERLRTIKIIALDKTGTITGDHEKFKYVGQPLTVHESNLVYSLTLQSNHPYSRALSKALAEGCQLQALHHFKQDFGQGISGAFGADFVKIGNSSYLDRPLGSHAAGGRVHIQINDTYFGFFQFQNELRRGIDQSLENLSKNFELHLISGDHQSSHLGISNILQHFKSSQFEQLPHHKMAAINNWQKSGPVMMVGDGLNDAIALSKSDVGIAISDRSNHFSPACDVLMAGHSFVHLPALLNVAKGGQYIIYASFFLSLLYNSIGLTYATQGLLSPLVAAILMPLSSITIIVFTHLTTRWLCYISFKTDASHLQS